MQITRPQQCVRQVSAVILLIALMVVGIQPQPTPPNAALMSGLRRNTPELARTTKEGRNLQISSVITNEEWECYVGWLGSATCYWLKPVGLDPVLTSMFWIALVCLEEFAYKNNQTTQTSLSAFEYCDPSSLELHIAGNRSQMCREGSLKPDGTLAYDCRNILSNNNTYVVSSSTINETFTVSCPARNSRGVCTNSSSDRSFLTWSCTGFSHLAGGGYLCRHRPMNVPYEILSNPAFDPYNSSIVPGSTTRLYCNNTIYGQAAADCEEPICIISQTNEEEDSYSYRECESCEILPYSETGPLFAYDCAKAFPELSCPIRDAKGICLSSKEPADAPPTLEEEIEAWWTNKPSRVEAAEAAAMRNTLSSSSSSSSKWVLKIDPSLFNVLSDVFAHVSLVFLGMAIASMYPLWTIWRLKSGGFIPLNQIGQMPSSIFETFDLVSSWSGSLLPLVFLVAILLISESSHAIADSGLDFVVDLEPGPTDLAVLVLTKDKRNHQWPIQLSGDPVTPRTSILSKPFLETGDSIQETLVREYSDTLRAMIDHGLGLISTADGECLYFELSDGDFAGFGTDFVPGDSWPIAQMDVEIPVDCDDVDMAIIEQVIGGVSPWEEPIEDTAAVPNCTMSERRSSGIFSFAEARDSTLLQPAKILEVASSENANTPQGARILLVDGNGDLFPNFYATPDDRRLARDRLDWRQGRLVSSVEGIVINNNLTIDLGHVVLATGGDLISKTGAGDLSGLFNGGGNFQRMYALIGEIPGECPPRPSGLSVSNDTDCIAIIQLHCNPFPEDEAPWYHKIYSSPMTQGATRCDVDALTLVWGQNFDADAELVSIVGGLYAMVRPTHFDKTYHLFARRCIFVAMLALSTVETRPYIEEVVRPSINLTYVVFMLFPLVMGLALLFLVNFFTATESSKLPSVRIPETLWQIMVTAKESDSIPVRESFDQSYPEENADPYKDLRLGFQTDMRVCDGDEQVVHIIKKADDSHRQIPE